MIIIFGCKEHTKKEIPIAELEKKFVDYYKKLPELKKLSKTKEYNFNVKYVIDPDLPSLDIKKLKKVFHLCKKITHDLIGYKINFKLIQTIDIYKFFEEKKQDLNREPFSYIPRSWYIDPDSKNAFSESLKAVKKAVSKKDDKLVFSYFGKPNDYNPKKKPKYDKEKYAKKITKEFFKNLKGIYNEPDLKKRPLYSHKRKYHFSFAHWDVIAWQEKEADIIITNTVIAGPDTGMPMYVITRGGVSSAFIENNEFRPYQGIGVFPLYQFLSDGEFFNEKRGKLSLKEKIEITAYMWLHEFGHLLMRKTENYDLDGSVHKTATDLNYLGWMKNVKKMHKKVKGKIENLKKY
jgi:hypothetical protein